MKPTSPSLTVDTLQSTVVSPGTRIPNKLRRSQAVRLHTLEKGELHSDQYPPTPGVEIKTASPSSSRLEVEEDVFSLSDAHPSASNSILVQQFEGSFESKKNINILSSADRLTIYKQEVIQKILSVNLQPSLAIQEFQKIFADFLGKISSDLVGTHDSDSPSILKSPEVKSGNIQRELKHTPVEIKDHSLEDFTLITDGEVSMASDLFRGLKSSNHETKQNNQFNSIVTETPEKSLEKDAQSPNIGLIPETPIPKISTPTQKKQIRKGPRKKLLSNLEEKKESPLVTKSSIPINTAGPIFSPSLDHTCTSIFQQKSPSKSTYNEVRNYLDDRYQPVSDGIVGILDEHKKFIFDLPPTFWPILPMGYKWFHVSKKTLPIVKKHPENKERKFEITAFGPNDQKDPLKRINYVTWFDQFNVQAYANTRPKKSTYPEKCTKYPITVKDYTTSDGIRYDRGHCIDHKDTISQSGKEKLSTAHPKNFIPEPTFWNRPLRRTWVGQIRTNAPKGHKLTAKQSQGAYMQRVYYHPISLYDPSDALLTTNNNTPIPVGVRIFPKLIGKEV